MSQILQKIQILQNQLDDMSKKQGKMDKNVKNEVAKQF